MTTFRHVLPRLSPDEVERLVRERPPTPEDGLSLEVRDGLVEGRVHASRSATPRLQGRLSTHPDGTRLEGRLDYTVPLAFVLVYGALTACCAGFAVLTAMDGHWQAFAVLAVGATVLLVVTWLSLHAGIAHKDDDAEWLRRQLTGYVDRVAGGTLEA